MPTFPVSEIKIGKRARSKAGDVSSLAESITAVGLLHPVVVTPDHRLIAGGRRLAAAKLLGWSKIPVTVASNVTEAKDMLLAERDENVQREALSPLEAKAIRDALSPYLEAEAKKRQEDAAKEAASSGGKAGGKGRAKPSAQKTRKAKGRGKRASEEAAEGTGYSASSLDKVDVIAAKAEAQPELFAEVLEKLAETHNINAAVKAVAKIEETAAVTAAAAEIADSPSDAYDLRVCSMRDLLSEVRDIDAIITDPPYPEEFLPLYGELAQFAKKALKPDGVLAAMCGQSYLPRILADMAKHMEYRWTIAYLTPGGQAVQLWDRKVNTFWKPIVIFGGKPGWTGDVVKSDVNDNDKRFHGWGQSESGMARLVEALTKPGALVCDPFLGAGTTAVACLTRGRRFVGCDIDASCIETSRGRVALALGDSRK